jgi:hypothetical protein
MDDWRRLNSLPLRFNYKMRKADHQIISNYIVYFIFSHFVYSFINILDRESLSYIVKTISYWWTCHRKRTLKRHSFPIIYISECLIYFRNIILKESNLASMLLAKTIHGKIQITFEFMEMMIVDKAKRAFFSCTSWWETVTFDEMIVMMVCIRQNTDLDLKCAS